MDETQKVVLELRSLNLEELQVFLASIAVPAYRARQILDWLHKKHIADFPEMKNIPRELQAALSMCAFAGALQLQEVFQTAEDNSRKYLFKTHDGHLLESVLISQKDRKTVCVSTQLGCRRKCLFCASGKGKFIRNLSAGEIVEQVSMVARQLQSEDSKRRESDSGTITNVVFMGMGEPLDNYGGTLRAIEILTAEWGFCFGGRRITVSTCGVTPRIAQFVEETKGRVRLSISLHSSRQGTREKLMPIAKQYPLEDLIEVLLKLQRELHREITFEYTLIKGVNDSAEEAKEVARLANLIGAKINLIPYNPIRELDWQSPSPADLEKFRSFLEKKNVRVTLRQTVGQGIHGACGQLRIDHSSFAGF